MIKIIRVVFGLIGILLTPATLLAHPGHGNENPLSPGHYLANPEHFLPLTFTVVAVFAAVFTNRSYLNQSKQNK